MRLRHIVASMGLSMMLGTAAYAAGPDEDYVRIYKIIVEADALRGGGQNADALRLYRSAQDALDRFQKAYPAWNDRLVNYRIGYVTDQIKPLQSAPAVVAPAPAIAAPTIIPPSTRTTPEPTPANTAITPAPVTPSQPAPISNPEAEQLRMENQQLKQAAARLEAKLKEALSIQPAPNDSQAMEAVQTKLRDLAKENDLLKASLKAQQDRLAAATPAPTVATPPPAPAAPPPAPKPVVVMTNDPAVLADLNNLRQNVTNQLNRLAMLQTENEVLKKELATAKTAPPTPPPVNPELEKQLQQATKDVQAFQSANQQLKDRQSQLEKQLDEARKTQGTQAERLKQVEQLERDLATTRSDAAKLNEQKQALEKRLTETAKTSDAGSSTHILRLEKQLIEAQSESRLFQRQKGALEERLNAAQSQAARAQAPDSKPTLIVPGAGGEAVSADVNRQLKQAAWEVLNLQSSNQELQKKAASLEKQLAGLNTTKATFDNVDADRLKRLETIQQDLSESRRQAQKLEQENQQMARQLAAEREARSTLATDDRSSISRKLEETVRQLQRAEASNQELQRKNTSLEKEVADLRTAVKSASLASASSTAAPTVVVKPSPETERQLAEARTQLARLEEEKNELEKRLSSADQQGNKRSSSRARNRDIEREVTALRARLDVLEAKPVPYTESELSLFSRLEVNLASPTTAGASPANNNGSVAANSTQNSNRANAPVPNSTEPLAKPSVSTSAPPPGTSELMSEARRDFDGGRFADAERKFQDILKKDDRNVYVLNHLAAAQFEQQKLKDADQTVQRALQVSSDDPAALYMLGTVRLRQDRVDDAVDALSRASKLSPDNAITHNALGVALSTKGLRDPAETAFRRALQLKPEYADAHYNLAVEYALQKPPSYKLAHFHYQRALAAGHARSAELEKHIERAGAGVTQP